MMVVILREDATSESYVAIVTMCTRPPSRLGQLPNTTLNTPHHNRRVLGHNEFILWGGRFVFYHDGPIAEQKR
jgi:hypothetical protein